MIPGLCLALITASGSSPELDMPLSTPSPPDLLLSHLPCFHTHFPAYLPLQNQLALAALSQCEPKRQIHSTVITYMGRLHINLFFPDL